MQLGLKANSQPRSTHFIFCLLLILFFSTAQSAQASDKYALLEQAKLEQLYTPTKMWHFDLTVGYGEWDNPLHDQHPQPLFILPKISYYSERFYLENFRLGYALYETPHSSIDVISDLNLDGIYFNQSYLISSLTSNFNRFSINDELRFDYAKHRHLSYMTGLKWSYINDFRLGAKLLTDMTKVHNGYEAQFMLGKFWQLKHSSVGLNLVVEYKSSKLIDYYYGIELEETAVMLTENQKAVIKEGLLNANYDSAEIDAMIPDKVYMNTHTYQGRSSFNYIIEALWQIPLTHSLSMITKLQLQYLGDGIAQSPLIKESKLSNYFIGINWSW